MSCPSELTMVAVNRPEVVYFSSGPARLYKKLHAKQTQVGWIGCMHCTGLPFKPGEVVGRLPYLISATSCGEANFCTSKSHNIAGEASIAIS